MIRLTDWPAVYRSSDDILWHETAGLTVQWRPVEMSRRVCDWWPSFRLMSRHNQFILYLSTDLIVHVFWLHTSNHHITSTTSHHHRHQHQINIRIIIMMHSSDSSTQLSSIDSSRFVATTHTDYHKTRKKRLVNDASLTKQNFLKSQHFNFSFSQRVMSLPTQFPLLYKTRNMKFT